jgi:putative pyruvate formate lyase activating enzyme
MARGSLVSCRLCAHECGANRLEGQLGPCRADSWTRVFTAQTEVADESELAPVFAIALSGCDLRCSFCVTGAQSWNPRAGDLLDPVEVARRARRALERGARTIMILGGEPTIHLPFALELVAALPDDSTLIWKTNAHESPQANAWLDGLFDIWVADFKFGNEECARRLARIDRYTEVVQANLAWANSHTRLIVRHLLMPGHVECCWRPAAEWLAASLPDVEVSLRDGFWPAWQSGRHPELRRTSNMAEMDRAKAIARECELNLIQ